MMSGFTEKYDVVVGAGHAGREAAMAARMEPGTTLYAIILHLIAQMSCNPAEYGEDKMQQENP